MADANVTLGRGKVLFAPYLLNQKSGGSRGDFGNAPSFTIQTTSQALDHYSSRKGLKQLDKSVVLQTDETITFVVDNVTPGNLALWFGADVGGAEPSDAPNDLGTIQLIGDAKSIYGGLFFEADNAVGGNNNFWWPYVNLQPNGNFDLLGDAWQQMGFTAKVLKRDDATARVYVYQDTGGASVADADTSPEFTPMSASVVAGTLATGGTVTAPATGAVDAVENITFTLTGGTVAYAYLHDGTAIVGSAVTVSGASGSFHVTPHLADTYTVKLYGNPAGTGSVLATSGNMVIS